MTSHPLQTLLHLFEQRKTKFDLIYYRILEAYRRMEGPLVVELDAKGSEIQLMDAALEAIRSNGLFK